jgi:glycosyltransferase involved in cell wall biosynthesis
MKIAQVAPLYERVPPVCYGGTERVVSYLTEELVRQGHEVTLFASGDSITGAMLIASCERSLRLNPECIDQSAYHVLQLEQVFQRAETFDVVHFHTDYMHFPLSRGRKICQLTTLHGRLDIADLVPLYREFRDMPVVSISDAQRLPLPWIKWMATIYHGLPATCYEFRRLPGSYLAFIGRISPEKRVDRAIEIAKLANMPLKIAAKISEIDRKYVERKIQPMLDHPLVEFIGEVGEKEKGDLLGNAYALLFPIDWAEPFGLVMIESLACGTPVIAYRHGSVPEIINDGSTGFIVNSRKSAVHALEKVQYLDRRLCRSVFEERFSASRMTNDYLRVYETVYEEKRRISPRNRSSPARKALAGAVSDVAVAARSSSETSESN